MYEKTTLVTNTRNNQTVEAEADNVRSGESLDVFLANTKIHMRWNGKFMLAIWLAWSLLQWDQNKYKN